MESYTSPKSISRDLSDNLDSRTGVWRCSPKVNKGHVTPLEPLVAVVQPGLEQFMSKGTPREVLNDYHCGRPSVLRECGT